MSVQQTHEVGGQRSPVAVLDEAMTQGRREISPWVRFAFQALFMVGPPGRPRRRFFERAGVDPEVVHDVQRDEKQQ